VTEQSDRPENTGPDESEAPKKPFEEPATGSFGSPPAPPSSDAVPPPPPSAPAPSPPPGPVPPASQSPQVPPPPPMGQPPAGYGAANYPAAGYPAPGYQAPTGPTGPTTSSNAVLSLVMGILSFFVCPVILAVIAIVYGNKAKDEIAASNGAIGGSGLATAGRILGWVNLILGLLTVVFVVVFAIAAAS